jgi:HK97 family phage prohead protease
MTENLFRSFASPDLQVRSRGDGRTVFGIAVPYNAATRIDDTLIEQFARGAFNHQLDQPQKIEFAREHVLLGGELIGAASLLKDDPAGLYVELRAAKTPAGDATLELVREQALDQLSIWFRPGKDRNLGRGHVERVVADLREVAIVMEGAYGELAMAAGVRSRRQEPDVRGRQSGPSFSEEEMDLRSQAMQYLAPSARRELPDHDLEIRSIKLGLPR